MAGGAENCVRYTSAVPQDRSGLERLVVLGEPKPHCIIRAGGQDETAIRTELRAQHSIWMQHTGGDLLSGCGHPNPCFAIKTGCHEVAVVRAERGIHDPIEVFERWPERLAIRG